MKPDERRWEEKFMKANKKLKSMMTWKMGAAIILALAIMLISGLALSPQTARAYPSELILAPTARIMPHQGSVGAALIGGQIRISGVYRIENFVELGGQVLTRAEEGPELGILAKVRLVREGPQFADLSLGIKGRSLFIAASRSLGDIADVHIGLAETGLEGMFLGLNGVINPDVLQIRREEDGKFVVPRTDIRAEYYQQSFNFGARMNLTPEVTAELGIMNLESLKAGIDFSF